MDELIFLGMPALTFLIGVVLTIGIALGETDTVGVFAGIGLGLILSFTAAFLWPFTWLIAILGGLVLLVNRAREARRL